MRVVVLGVVCDYWNLHRLGIDYQPQVTRVVGRASILARYVTVVPHRVPELSSLKRLLAVDPRTVVIVLLLALHVSLIVHYLQAITSVVMIETLHLKVVACVFRVLTIIGRLLVSVRLSEVLSCMRTPDVRLVPFVTAGQSSCQ